MRRYITLTVLAAFFMVLFAACTDDPPKYTEGCNPSEGGRPIYERDFGCTSGTVERSGESGEEGEDHEAGESVEGVSEEQTEEGESEETTDESGETETTESEETTE